MGFYCFKDKSGHCQSKHATYHETSGGSYDGDSGGGDGSSSPGETVGGLILLAAIVGVICWVLVSLNDWMDSNHSTNQEASFTGASYADSSQPAGGMNRLLSVAKGRDGRPFFATTIWKDGSFPGIVLTEGSDSIAFNLQSNATIGNGSLQLPAPGDWSKNFHFPKDVEFTCSITCGDFDLAFIDRDGLAVATTRTSNSTDIDHFFTRSFSIRPHGYNGLALMIVSISRPKNVGVESERKKAQSSSADSSDRAASQWSSGPRSYYVSREEANRNQLELERKKVEEEANRTPGIREGRPTLVVYRLREGELDGRWNLMLSKAGQQYGPFIASPSIRFRCIFGVEQAGRWKVLSSEWREGNVGIHSDGYKDFITEADTLEFYLVPLVDNVPFSFEIVRR